MMKKYTLDREDTILFIIDIQERLVPVMKYKDEVINNTLTLLEISKIMDMPVIITEQYPRGLGSTLPEIKENMGPEAEVFEKISFSGFTEEVKLALEKTGRKKIIITGMETHVCIYQTVRDLLDKGYEVFIAQDGVASRTKNNFLSGLELMKSMGGIITNTETIAFDLLKKAGSPEFKLISKLIK